MDGTAGPAGRAMTLPAPSVTTDSRPLRLQRYREFPTHPHTCATLFTRASVPPLQTIDNYVQSIWS